ncbi:MAG TPA: zf-HC2 domain-containing protein [Thermoanaerobaculia bacterium]|nr:zf-HC2 domain-containing protein [Thermoanaerobaculia bacterium]
MSEDLGAWLRETYEDAGCPPPEAYLEEEMAALSPADRQRLESHADRCPACAAERDLARSFDAGPAGLPAADVDFVVSRLEEASPVRPARGRVVPFRTRTAAAPPAASRPAAPAWRIAAALFVILGAVLLFQLTRPGGPPALPAPETGGVFRGGAVETISPLGAIAVIPDELLWERVEGARSYKVRLLAVDDTVLWETTVSEPPARLPADVFGSLHPAVSYTWTVEALGGSGERLAVSEPAQFRARPVP